MGPAYVSLKIDLGLLFQGYFIQTIQPEEQFLQRVTHRIIAKPHNQLLLTKLYLQSERFQVSPHDSKNYAFELSWYFLV